MILSWLIASIHLLALPLGVAAVWARGREFSKLNGVKGAGTLKPVFTADNFWGLAALLWIATGLLRAFAGFGKGSDYYLHFWVFHVKMGLFLLIFLLEIRPMVTLIQWRLSVRRSQPIDTSSAPTLARISYLQLGLLVPMVFAAVALARGYLY